MLFIIRYRVDNDYIELKNTCFFNEQLVPRRYRRYQQYCSAILIHKNTCNYEFGQCSSEFLDLTPNNVYIVLNFFYTYNENVDNVHCIFLTLCS